MFKKLKRLFKRKKYATIYSNECVINARQQEAFTAHKRVMDALEELEAKEVPITEEEVGEAVAKAIGERFRYLQENMKHSTTNCPNCGAPLHGNKCNYCGTEL